MAYHVQVAKLFFRREDSFFQLKRAERITGLWKRVFLFLFLSMLVYGFTAWKGLGMDPISVMATELSFATYESVKIYFLFGRILYGLLLTFIILFFTPLIFWIFSDIDYKKLVTVQFNVLFIMLVERLTWVGFVQYLGLDWYVSPLSFGIITSYITDITSIIYFFGAVSVFQIWIMWFQGKAIRDFCDMKRWKVAILVGTVHVFYWAVTAVIALYDHALL